VVSGDRVLLVKHRKLSLWLPPGGHIERNERGDYIESPEEAAVREVLEETSYHVRIIGKRVPSRSERRTPLIVPEDNHIHPINDEHDHFGFDFYAVLEPLEQPEGKGDEEYAWFDSGQLVELAGSERDGARLDEDVAYRALNALQAALKRG